MESDKSDADKAALGSKIPDLDQTPKCSPEVLDTHDEIQGAKKSIIVSMPAFYQSTAILLFRRCLRV